MSNICHRLKAWQMFVLELTGTLVAKRFHPGFFIAVDDRQNYSLVHSHQLQLYRKGTERNALHKNFHIFVRVTNSMPKLHTFGNANTKLVNNLSLSIFIVKFVV